MLAVNPLQAARFRDRHAVSGAKSDRGDAHALADMARTDAHQLRPVAADGDLRTSPGARAFYDTHRACGLGHNAARRHLANHLAGILPGCLKTRTTFNEHTAWAHRSTLAA